MVEFSESNNINENFLDESEDGQFQDSSIALETELIAANNLDKETEDKIEAYIKCRLEPINEVVLSERSYVRRLKIISEKYIPLLEDNSVNLPDDLTNKWRIIWGNWIQLDEWHSSFLEKLEKVVVADPDLIPKLFVDSRARLRTIYSKYCENHRKATVIAEQYKEFFDERRIFFGDKQDVVSHLMQPIQRIMRYQLPMSLIVKLTKRANLPSLLLWEKALEVMKEIPKEAQLILEAARIDGFPQSITALGYIRMRSELNVAITSKMELEREGFSISDLKFLERRVFLFDQMLLLTEEVKLKRKDPFAQSSYSFRNAVNVNKMKFHPRCTFASDSVQLEHDMMFMISDESPGRDKVYIIDPVKAENREQWVIQLRDIQRMQQELLLALQDPKRFANKGDSGGKDHNLLKPTQDSEALKDGGNTCKKKQKWPSFNSGKGGSVLIKHLRPHADKHTEIAHTGSTRGCSADRKCLDTDDKSSVSKVNCVNTSDSELNKSPQKVCGNSKNMKKIQCYILNDGDPITIKQDPKIGSHSHSKSDELGVTNSQLLNSGTNTAPVSSHSHKKKSGNIFHMFSANSNRNKNSSTPQNNN